MNPTPIQRAEIPRLPGWESSLVERGLRPVADANPRDVNRAVVGRGRGRRSVLEGLIELDGGASFLGMSFLRQPQETSNNGLWWLLACAAALVPIGLLILWVAIQGSFELFAHPRRLILAGVASVAAFGAVVQLSHKRRQTQARRAIPARFPPGLLLRKDQLWVVYPDAAFAFDRRSFVRATVGSGQEGLAAGGAVQLQRSLEFIVSKDGNEHSVLIHEVLSSDFGEEAEAQTALLLTVTTWLSENVPV